MISFSSASVVISITGTQRLPASALMRRVASMPSIPGITTSINTRSGGSSW